MTNAAEAHFDGAKLALLANRFVGVARKMSNTLLRTGRSGVLNRAKDFSCCIVTASGDLLTTADSLPIHVLSGPDLMAKSMTDFHRFLRKGDAFIHNSPYHGCSHAADQTILVPVLDDDGTHQFTVLAKAHQADIGNSVPTTYMGSAKDVYNEGALIFPCIQVQQDYLDNTDILRMCEARIRVPEQWRGDYLAASGAARIGERELIALADEFGWGVLAQFAREWLDYSERRMERAISALPRGIASVVSRHDPFPGTPEDGVPIRSTVEILPDVGRIEVDLTQNADCMPCGLNLSEACSRTSALVGVFNSIDSTIPKNAGSFRRVTVHLRENCVVGIPRHPTSCSAATTNLADRVANGVQRAFAEIADGIGLAEFGALIPPAGGVLSGRDPRTNREYVNQVILGITGGAAGPRGDGWLTAVDVGTAGLACLDAVELDELYHPILVESRELVPDSEGAGRQIGSQAIRVVFGPVGAAMEVAFGSDGQFNPALGARGGLAGGKSDQLLRTRDGVEAQLPPCMIATIKDGEAIISIGAGGGGYGPPVDRDPRAVFEAFKEGLLSKDRAHQIYGVSILNGELDEDGTRVARARMLEEM